MISRTKTNSFLLSNQIHHTFITKFTHLQESHVGNQNKRQFCQGIRSAANSQGISYTVFETAEQCKPADPVGKVDIWGLHQKDTAGEKPSTISIGNWHRRSVLIMDPREGEWRETCRSPGRTYN